MAKFKKKPVIIEAITFDELIAIGKEQVEEGDLHNGMPWVINYGDQQITHQADNIYLVNTASGFARFTPTDMLITQIDGELYPCRLDVFNLTYIRIEE